MEPKVQQRGSISLGLSAPRAGPGQPPLASCISSETHRDPRRPEWLGLLTQPADLVSFGSDRRESRLEKQRSSPSPEALGQALLPAAPRQPPPALNSRCGARLSVSLCEVCEA